MLTGISLASDGIEDFCSGTPSCSGERMRSDLSGADHVHSAEISALVKSSILNQSTRPADDSPVKLEVAHRAAHQVDYRVADLFGRCFLRVCFLLDMVSSWSRRNKPLVIPPPGFSSSKRATAEVLVAASALQHANGGASSVPTGNA